MNTSFMPECSFNWIMCAGSSTYKGILSVDTRTKMCNLCVCFKGVIPWVKEQANKGQKGKGQKSTLWNINQTTWWTNIKHKLHSHCWEYRTSVGWKRKFFLDYGVFIDKFNLVCPEQQYKVITKAIPQAMLNMKTH